MKVLVTGCAGRVGQAVTAHLIEEGFDVRGIDVVDACDGYGDYHRCDLLDGESLLPYLEGVDTILHLAAIAAPGRGANARIFQVNTVGTFNVFDGCANVGVRRVVVASSINAIGYYFCTNPYEISYLPVDEEHPKDTSDAYSFSKQVTEDIGQYFWKRDGIANTCLRFGAGLRPIEELRDKQTASTVEAAARAAELLELPDSERVSEVQRMQQAYDEERRNRMYERQAGRTADLTPADHRLMSLKHNYLSFVALEDACRAMAMALTAEYDGSHPLFILDRNNILMMDAEDLANLLYPDVANREPLQGTQSLLDWRRAAYLIGFETEIPAGALFE